MNYPLRLTGAFLGAALAAQGASAAVTFDKLFVQARSQITGSGVPFNSDGQSTTLSTLPADPIVQTTSSDFGNAGGSRSASGSTAATFAGPTSGSVDYAATANITIRADGASGSAQVLNEFFYDFTSDTAFRVFFDYAVFIQTTEPFGPSARLELFEANNPVSLFGLEGLSSSGNAATGVIAAGSYRLQFGDDDILGIGRNTIGTSTESIAANVGFDILPATVPEPATWAMTIVGVAVVGGALRRRTGTAPRRFARASA